ncbi:MAG: SusC/RagA family TonB-linked outer membrane protein [Marinilabiliaceae bacterium]|nr:SusC/RagA family TonB-linked outer membrane protein [Marinilabiliaceae bacterium]
MLKAVKIISLFRHKLNIASLLIVFLTCNMFAQETGNNDVDFKIVKGIVRDAKTKEPVFAAIVSTQLQLASSITDEEGAFELEISSLTDVLTIEAYNYGVREVAIKGRNYIEIELFSDLFSNTYKKVETFTGEVNSSNLTIGATKVDNVNNGAYFTVDQAIQNQLGGDLRAISRSGALDIGSNLFIRGFNSLNANNQPLYIVDGVIWNNLNSAPTLHTGYFSNPLANIDMIDVESITVIKDGTSIYGSKAANGVVLIRTKRGKNEVTRITAHAMMGVSEKPETFPVLDAGNYRILISDMLGDIDPNDNVTSSLEFLDDNTERYYYPVYHNETNWNDFIYRTSTTQSYGVDVNGGDEKALYSFSLGYTMHDGIVKNTDLDRLNTRFNADFKFTNNFNLGMNISFSNIIKNVFDEGVGSNNSIAYLTYIKAPFLSPYEYTKLGESTSKIGKSDFLGVGNPLGIIENGFNNTRQWRFKFGVKPTFSILPGLTLSSNFDYSLDKATEYYYRPVVGSAPTIIYVNGEATESVNELRSMYMRDVMFYDDTRLSYNKIFDGSHILNANLGWRFVSDYYEMDYKSGHNSGRDDTKLMEQFTDKRVYTGLNDRYKTVSSYISVDYSYKNKYLLNLAASLDASSRFGNETQGGIEMMGASWGLFPSVTGAWNVSSESFMKNITVVDRLRLRAGFGITGNDNISPYVSQSYFEQMNYGGSSTGLVIGNIANNQIQWETTRRINAGIDMGLLNERINIAFEGYSSTTSDMFALKAYPEYTGKGLYWSNGGEMTNVGFEGSINYKVLNLKSLKWELGARIGHYKNEITALPDNKIVYTKLYGAEIITEVGNPAGLFYGYKTKGVFSTTAQAEDAGLKIVDVYGNVIDYTAGDIEFEEVLKDGYIDENDKQIIGDPNPDFYGSFSSKISYKRFTLDAYFTYSYGNDIYNANRYQLEKGSDFNNQTIVMMNRWKSEGDNTTIPKVEYGDPMGNSRFSDRWIEDGSYLKLKSVTLSFDVPIKAPGFEGVTVWASANNLLTLTNYLGLDPEVSAGQHTLYQGIDTGLLPNLRSYFVGLRLKL